VFGAQAVTVHGVPRLSADVDITLFLNPDQPQAFAAAMRDAGFQLRITDPDFIRRTRVIPFVHEATGMPLDIVLAASGLEDEFLARATPVVVGGATVPVIDVGDLIVAKILAGRPKDVEDVRALWRVHRRTLDVERIRGILVLLEEALSQSDLVPGWDDIVRVENGA
jgi:hypothetical protein